MRHRRSNANAVSADLVEYLVVHRGMTQDQIAGVLDVDKSFVSRVRKSERDLSSNQMRLIADHLDVPLGAMLIAAMKPSFSPRVSEHRELEEICERLMREADRVVEAARDERIARRKQAS